MDLRLKFVRHIYGPFSPELNRALAAMEGHDIVGYGDGTGGARADLRLRPGVADRAETRVREDEVFARAWDQVQQAILGLEYPEGLELISSVHLLSASVDGAHGPEALARALDEWSPRKRELFSEDDVRTAWERLAKSSLLPAGAS